MTYEEIKSFFDGLRRADYWQGDNNAYDVLFKDPKSTWVSMDAKIGKGALIFPGCVIMGVSTIGERCVLWPHTTLINVCVEEDSEIGLPIHKNSYVRKNVVVGRNAEINRTIIGEGAKMVHHGYLGDTTVGKNSNIGAGAITANYDGEKKTTTIIGEQSFIGVNTNLIAPNEFPQGTYIAAGSTIPAMITKFKEYKQPFSLFISRVKDVVIKTRKRV